MKMIEGQGLEYRRRIEGLHEGSPVAFTIFIFNNTNKNKIKYQVILIGIQQLSRERGPHSSSSTTCGKIVSQVK